MKWIAIDPGPESSGVVVYEKGRVLGSDNMLNARLASRLRQMTGSGRSLAIEMIASYGMAVGRSTFETCVWIGRFMEAWNQDSTVRRLTRPEIMLHLCHSPRAKPTNIRQALIDRLGPVGTKKEPGPLYGVKTHAWAALAVAVTADDKFGGAS